MHHFDFGIIQGSVLNEITVQKFKKQEEEKKSEMEKLNKELEETKKQIENPNYYSDYWRKKYIKLLNELLDDTIPSTEEIMDLIDEAERKKVH